MAELLFHGAAGEVTGSLHLLRVDAGWVALDCGLFQGRRAESEEKNRTWPMPPNQIRAVVLSHAHTDHTGRLPKLAADGFTGAIFATSATRDLCAIMLADSAHIQMEDAAYLNRKRARKGLPPITPLYTDRDAVAAVKLFETIDYGRWFEVVPGLKARYHEAGHMLGSAGVELEIAGPPLRRIYFTGDVGRSGTPILRDPAGFPEADVLICESTYGGRVNEAVHDGQDRMRDVVKRTWARNGKIVIPAFSIGRTQTVVYFLHRLMDAGEIPRHPIFVDSPLAVSASEIFRLHPECYDEDARAFHTRTRGFLGNGCCTYVQSVEESKNLNRFKGSCAIISASGMCEAGRILHHLRNNIEKPANTVLIPGFQAAGTLGRRLVEGEKRVNIFHDSFAVRAEVVQIHGFSGHADQSDLLRMLSALRQAAPRVFLVHGEGDQSGALAEKLRTQGFSNVDVAARGQRITL